ncbi:MAG: ankyrin repeat-containing domain protein [Monoraphidium minutum]|nr:MAG: ankyrin repeat-containing domain protein [Monoraphidium minutum]
MIPDMTGSCALHVAAEAGAEDAARRLLPRLTKEQVDQRDLHLSEYSQGSWLSKDRGEVIAPWDKTALAIAADAGDEGMVSLLLGAGADPNIEDYDGACPLHAALEAGEEGLVALLLAAGADPNKPSKDMASCLHAAAQRGPVSLLKALLASKADPRAVNEDGWSPLHLAARAGAAEKVRLLLAVTNSRTEVQRILEEAGGGGGAAAAATAAAAPALATA